MNLSRPELHDATLDLAVAAAAVANHCDHAEHNGHRRREQTLLARIEVHAGQPPVAEKCW